MEWFIEKRDELYQFKAQPRHIKHIITCYKMSRDYT